MPHQFVKDWTQTLPFPDATDMHFRISSNLALMSAWTAALTGQFMISQVIGLMARQIGARNIAVYRKTDKKVLPIAAAVRPLEQQNPEQSSGNICRYLKATRMDGLLPGAIFRLTELRKEPKFHTSAAAREWEGRSDVLEVSLLILEANAQKVDVMELIFDKPVDRHPDFPAELVTQAMANSWELRSPGLMTCLIQANGRERTPATAQSQSPIMGADNPCGLSRAEQRVCKMLVDGMSARGIADALGLSMPTVRSHLRNIYAKTETSGQIELLAVVNTRGGNEESGA